MEHLDPVVPPSDDAIRAALQLLEAPVVVSAESAADRRVRLHKLMVDRGYSSFEDIRDKQGHVALELSSEALHQQQQKPKLDEGWHGAGIPVIQPRVKEKFSRASPALVAKRAELLPLTIERAGRRLSSLKEAFVASISAVRPAHHAAVKQIQRMRLTKSVRNVKMTGRNGAGGASSTVVGTLCMPFTCCAAMAMLPNTVVTGAADGVVTLWDTAACVPHASVSSCESGWGRVQHLTSHPTAPLVFSTTMFDYRISSWRITGDSSIRDEMGSGNAGLSLERVAVGESQHIARIQHLAVDPIGLTLASTSDDATVCLWDIEASAPMGQLRHLVMQDGYETARGTLDVSFHPDGSLLATTDKAGRVVVWDLRNGMHVFTTGGKYGGHLHSCTCVSWSPCGVRLASGGADNLLHLWDARYLCRGTAQAPCILTGHEDVITSLQFRANPAFPFLPVSIVSTSLDGTVRFWDMDTVGACTHVLQGLFPVRAQCWPMDSAGNNALLTVAHSKYWSMWNTVADGEECEVIHKETEMTMTTHLSHLAVAENEEDEDEMLALRRPRVEAVPNDMAEVSLGGSDEGGCSSDEDEMHFLKKRVD